MSITYILVFAGAVNAIPFQKNNNAELDDPSLGLPKERLEKSLRIQRGPYQPRIAHYPVKIMGNGDNARNRSFKSNWYDTYKWLEYSPIKDSAYCFVCRCFGMNNYSFTGGAPETAFIYSGFSSWNKAVERFKCHQTTKCHLSSLESWENFKTSKAIDVQLDEQKEVQLKTREKQRQQNVIYFKKLIDIVLTLVKGGKSLRGHNEREDSNERGLFLEIVKLLIKYDPEFRIYLENAPKNCTYLSNLIQNDILKAIKNVILRLVKDEIQGQSISVIADETSDVRHHEQISIVFRYIPSGSVLPVERFISLERLKVTDAETIFNSLNNCLQKMGILWENVEAVCFDGASTMSGNFTGVQARCKEKNKFIL